MAMSAVSTSTIISDVVTKLTTFLTNNLTTHSPTVYPHYPGQAVDFPLVIVSHAGERDEHIAIGTEYKQCYITIRFEVWTKSTKKRDEIWDDIYDELRHHYTTNDANGDSITGLGLHDMSIISCTDVETEASRERGGIHRKVAEIQFVFYAAS